MYTHIADLHTLYCATNTSFLSNSMLVFKKIYLAAVWILGLSFLVAALHSVAGVRELS